MKPRLDRVGLDVSDCAAFVLDPNANNIEAVCHGEPG